MWREFIGTDQVNFVGNNGEICFEKDDFDRFAGRLAETGVSYVHPIKEHAWGQRVVCFYGPDRRMIEVGENMTAVCRRFLQSGLTAEQTTKHMDMPRSYIKSCMA